MPCLHIQTDLSKGLVLPVRVSSFTGISMRLKATISTGFTDSLISPGAVERLRLVPVGETTITLPYAKITCVPFFIVQIDILFGLLGRRLSAYRLQRVMLLESDLARGRGIIIGASIISRGHLSMNANSITICM